MKTANSAGCVPAEVPITAPQPMPAQKCGPRNERARYLKPELAERSKQERKRHGLTQRDIAGALELQQPFVARCELDHEPDAPTALHIASATGDTRPWAEGLVRWQASKLRLQVLRAAVVVHGDNHAARLAAVATECTDPARALAVAAADGAFTDEELEQLAREARECAQAALELEQWVVTEQERRRALRTDGQ